MNQIVLPTKNESGEYYVSYSQIKMWHEAKGYNTGLDGKKEYIRKYFLGEKYPDKGGYGQFGTEVEGYITERTFFEQFTEPERITLEKIEPLGIYQHKVEIPFDGFHLLGFIDDMKPDFVHIRDYKTASEKSSEKYYLPEYKQMDIYALAGLKVTGKLPDKIELCIIERSGNGFRGGRPVLKVGEKIWYVERKVTKKSLKELEKYIFETVKEISEYYKIFLKLNT